MRGESERWYPFRSFQQGAERWGDIFYTFLFLVQEASLSSTLPSPEPVSPCRSDAGARLGLRARLLSRRRARPPRSPRRRRRWRRLRVRRVCVTASAWCVARRRWRRPPQAAPIRRQLGRREAAAAAASGEDGGGGRARDRRGGVRAKDETSALLCYVRARQRSVWKRGGTLELRLGLFTSFHAQPSAKFSVCMLF